MKISWPLNVLLFSSAFKKLFPAGSHLRECLELGFSVLNENFEIDSERVEKAAASTPHTKERIGEYAKAHILALQSLGPERAQLEKKLAAAQAKGKVPASLRGVECLIAGGIRDWWTQVVRTIIKELEAETAKLRKERIRTGGKNWLAKEKRLEEADDAIRKLQAELEACKKVQEELCKLQDDLRQLFEAFLKKFKSQPLEEIADMLELLPLIDIMPEVRQDFLDAAEEIRRINYDIVEPTALLFDFPEKSNSGRKIKYDPVFLLQAAKEFSTSKKSMTALRHALSSFVQDLDVKKSRQAKTKLPFALPEGYTNGDAYVLTVGDSWTVYYLMKRFEKRARVTVLSLQKNTN